MQRVYKKKALFDFRRLGFGMFTLFIVFVAFKILTPPSTEVARVESPDGSKTARLRKFYYISQPSYKVYYRETGKLVWLNLFYLPSYTNVPHETATESLEWGPGSENLDFKINGTSVWSHTFQNQD
jgi:hypothetical protein